MPASVTQAFSSPLEVLLTQERLCKTRMQPYTSKRLDDCSEDAVRHAGLCLLNACKRSSKSPSYMTVYSKVMKMSGCAWRYHFLMDEGRDLAPFLSIRAIMLSTFGDIPTYSCVAFTDRLHAQDLLGFIFASRATSFSRANLVAVYVAWTLPQFLAYVAHVL